MSVRCLHIFQVVYPILFKQILCVRHPKSCWCVNTTCKIMYLYMYLIALVVSSIASFSSLDYFRFPALPKERKIECHSTTGSLFESLPERYCSLQKLTHSTVPLVSEGYRYHLAVVRAATDEKNWMNYENVPSISWGMPASKSMPFKFRLIITVIMYASKPIKLTCIRKKYCGN